MRFARSHALSLTLSLLLLPRIALAQDHPEAAAKPAPDAKADALPPLPADASVAQTVTVNGKTLHYTATVGVLPIYSRTDPAKPETRTGEVVFTSYLLDGPGDKADRPVTFAMNGGP
ncbi:MAG TPA: hypothetical protein VGD62_07395, partial [Acidobacteriaceae bacterium]